MANQKRYYFYAPTWDCPPDGPIKLGNVLPSVKKPDRPIAYCQPSEECDVYHSDKRSVEYVADKMRSGRFSILTKWLSFLGLGVDVGHELSKTTKATFVFDRIETSHLVPAENFLQKCLETNSVTHFLELSRYRKPIYIITGIKTVFGAKVESARERSRNTALAVELDGTFWGGGAVPASGGPGLEAGVVKTETVSWKGSSDFVFAYRVSKVTVRSKPGGKVIKEGEYHKGALLEDGDGKVERPVLSIHKVEDFDAVAEGFDSLEATEEDHDVMCVYTAKDDNR